MKVATPRNLNGAGSALRNSPMQRSEDDDREWAAWGIRGYFDERETGIFIGAGRAWKAKR
jgi:hypothetical protein